MINILADNTLLLGYARGSRKILPSIVKECYEDLQLDSALPKKPPPESQQTAIREKNDRRFISLWKWATVLLLLIAISAVAIIHYGEPVLKRLPAIAPLSQQASADIISAERLLAKKIIEQKIEEAVKKDLSEKQTTAAEMTPDIELEKPEDTVTTKPEEPESLANNSDEKPREITIIVKEGETLLELAANVYGRSDESILNLLKKHNPGIKNINFIEVGQKIVFPPLTASDQGPTFTVHIGSYKPFENARKLFLELLERGYEAYIIPVQSAEKGKVFRITLGNFETPQEAAFFAKEIRKDNIAEYAKVIQLEMR